MPDALHEVRRATALALEGPRHREARGDARDRVSRRRASRGSIATSRAGKQVEKILDRVRAREIDILVGTQMVTKGHDLPHVTLVGVVNADAALSHPGLSRGRARLPAPRPGRRSRGPRRRARARPRPDVRSRAPRDRASPRRTTSTASSSASSRIAASSAIRRSRAWSSCASTRRTKHRAPRAPRAVLGD